MKTLRLFILLGFLCVNQCFAQVPIKIELLFKDVPKKWLSFIQESDRKRWTTKEGVSPFLPTVSKLGAPVASSFTSEYPMPDADEDDPAVECGIFVNLTPKKIDQQLFLVGTIVMKRFADSDSKEGTVRLESQEILIRSEVENGKPLLVTLADGGKLLITPTLLDPTGRPLGELKE